MTDFISDFLRGQKDCKACMACDQNESEAYIRGYSAQDSLNQVLAARGS